MIHVPDEAVVKAHDAYWGALNYDGIKGAEREFRAGIRTALEAALPYLQFSPLGDNHHNAAACPYCTPPDCSVVLLTDKERQALVWACRQPERAAQERQMFPDGPHALAFESARKKLS